jgi:hypothetical protein
MTLGDVAAELLEKACGDGRFARSVWMRCGAPTDLLVLISLKMMSAISRVMAFFRVGRKKVTRVATSDTERMESKPSL